MWVDISNMNAFLRTGGVKFPSGYYRFAVQAFIRSSGKKSGLGSVGSEAGSVEVFVSLQPLTSTTKNTSSAKPAPASLCSGPA